MKVLASKNGNNMGALSHGFKRSAPWYLSGGVVLTDVAGVWQPALSSSLANAYLRTAGAEGNANLDPAVSGGVAPSFSYLNGFIFANSAYLKTGIVPPTTAIWSIIIDCLNSTGSASSIGQIAANSYHLFQNNNGVNRTYYNSSKTAANVSGTKTDNNVFCMAGTKAYLNGVDEGVTLGNGSGTANALYIGAINNGTPLLPMTGYIRSFAIYKTILTPAQVLAISNAMIAMRNQNPYVLSFGIEGSANNYISLGNVLQKERTDAWSVRTVFIATSKPAYASILFTNVPAGDPYSGYELFITSTGKLCVRIMNTYSTNMIGVIGNTNVCDNTEHVVWATYDGSSSASGVKIYLDGVLQTMTTEQDTLSATIKHAGQDFYITNQQGPTQPATYYLRGYLKNFILDGAVRDQTYVTANSGASEVPTADENRQLTMLLTEQTGLVAHDTSGNSYDGTLTSENLWTSK